MNAVVAKRTKGDVNMPGETVGLIKKQKKKRSYDQPRVEFPGGSRGKIY